MKERLLKMKRKIRLFLTAVCILAMVGGLFTAYAIDAHDSGTKGVPDDDAYYYSFVLEASHHGSSQVGVEREKVLPNTYAKYKISTLVNTTGFKFYVNVRSYTYNCVAGTAHQVSASASAPLSFNVSYLGGYGNIGSYYCPSMQTSSSSTHGYVQIIGKWAP